MVGVASTFVRCEPGHKQLVETLLGRTVIVEDVETARMIVRRGLGSAVTVDGIDVVPEIEWMALPGVAAHISLALNAEPVEQHDGRVDAPIPRSRDTSPYAVEVGLVESSQVKLRLVVQGGARAGALVGHGIVVDRALLGLGIVASLPGP